MPLIKHFDFEIPNWTEFQQGPQPYAAPNLHTDPYRGLVLTTEPDRLESYLRLNDNSETSAADIFAADGTYAPSSSGSWTGGTLGQPPLITDSPDAASARFISTNRGYVRTNHTPGESGDLTLLFWFQSAGQTSGSGSSQRPLLAIPGRRNDGFAGGVASSSAAINILAIKSDVSPSVASPGDLAVVYGEGGTQIYSTSDGVDITDGDIHMVALVKEGSTGKFYYDGQLTGTRTFGPLEFTHPIHIGGSPTEPNNGDKRYFNGYIADVASWSATLSASQIHTLYQQGTAP